MMNLKNLNKFVYTEHFKIEGKKDLQKAGDWMTKVDVKDSPRLSTGMPSCALACSHNSPSTGRCLPACALLRNVLVCCVYSTGRERDELVKSQ